MEVLLGNNDNLFLCLKGFPFTVYTGDVWTMYELQKVQGGKNQTGQVSGKPHKSK